MPSQGTRNRDRGRRDRDRTSERKVILAKKHDEPSQDSTGSSKPKLLLKPKEVVVMTAEKQKPVEKLEEKPKEVVPCEEPAAARMLRSVQLLTTDQILNAENFSSYFRDTNNEYFVVGFIGLQNTGKSTLSNVLLDPEWILNSSIDEGIFTTRTRKHFSHIGPITEGIDMFVSNDRVIILDCEPFLTNRREKEYILNELDELKVLVFLLNVCHTLVIVENSAVNLSLIRMLNCAEMMRTHAKDIASAKVIFVQNKATRANMRQEITDRRQKLYRMMMKSSKLDFTYKKKDLEKSFNYIVFPDLRDFDLERICDKDAIKQHTLEFRRRVLMNKNSTFGSLNEKMWLQLMVKDWEQNTGNYFLKKYMGLKEKFNLLNHININDHHANNKDRNLYEE